MLSRVLVTLPVLLETISLRFLPTFMDTGHIQGVLSACKLIILRSGTVRRDCSEI
jgi:hypothetical protein